ncbi:hypothetical protein [Azospirillum argentinense]
MGQPWDVPWDNGLCPMGHSYLSYGTSGIVPWDTTAPRQCAIPIPVRTNRTDQRRKICPMGQSRLSLRTLADVSRDKCRCPMGQVPMSHGTSVREKSYPQGIFRASPGHQRPFPACFAHHARPRVVTDTPIRPISQHHVIRSASEMARRGSNSAILTAVVAMYQSQQPVRGMPMQMVGSMRRNKKLCIHGSCLRLFCTSPICISTIVQLQQACHRARLCRLPCFMV